MSVFFVTGAGTDIGKTYVSCALLRAWRAMGVVCNAFKPVVSGFDENDFAASDTAHLLSALDEALTPHTIAGMSPFRFKAPLAPPLAARAEGQTLRFADLETACQDRIRSRTGHLLIEGAGGVMSPLTDDKTCLDLILALDIPVIFLAGSYLGAVSHALSGLDVLATRGVKTSALVINETEPSIGLDATREMIRPHHPMLATITVQRNQPQTGAAELAAMLR